MASSVRDLLETGAVTLPRQEQTSKLACGLTVLLKPENVIGNRVSEQMSFEKDLHKARAYQLLLAGLEPKATTGTHCVSAQLLGKLSVEQL
jgi:hypothetical protein